MRQRQVDERRADAREASFSCRLSASQLSVGLVLDRVHCLSRVATGRRSEGCRKIDPTRDAECPDGDEGRARQRLHGARVVTGGEHRELVAVQVVGDDGQRTEHRAYLREDRVTRGVSKPIVHCLESIEIDVHEGKVRAARGK